MSLGFKHACASLPFPQSLIQAFLKRAAFLATQVFPAWPQPKAMTQGNSQRGAGFSSGQISYHGDHLNSSRGSHLIQQVRSLLCPSLSATQTGLGETKLVFSAGSALLISGYGKDVSGSWCHLVAGCSGPQLQSISESSKSVSAAQRSSRAASKPKGRVF